MDEMKELSVNEMAQATGGVLRTVNTGIADLDAAIRSGASKNTKQIAHLPNGTRVDTITDELVYDPVAGRNYVEISFTDQNGKTKTGWIAASIIGMKR